MHRRLAKLLTAVRARTKAALAIAAVLLLAVPLVDGAAISEPKTTLANLPQAQLSTSGAQGDYIIGPQDKLRIRVFEVKDLSFDEEEVDANGQIRPLSTLWKDGHVPKVVRITMNAVRVMGAAPVSRGLRIAWNDAGEMRAALAELDA